MSGDNFKDQASHLRDMMNEIDENSQSNMEVKEEETESEQDDHLVNILDLPPRSHVHANKKTGTKWKISFPLIRLLFVLFLLIVGLILTYQMWGQDWELESKASEEQGTSRVGEQVVVHNGETIIHVVKAGETLSSIAIQYYGNENAKYSIIRANSMMEETIQQGDNLIIP
ncbi:LysM peptidoglycan-binding domain-containing protein [Aquibacillus kalidii]|uniref:LysM peptidoglycan-binding domain-containing protein n=1 Tax=Aquibacillus kalidii TaxID=2762597 RepID=UPI00164443E5|nr:LysM domain-containing protein [Aquibacillus kalidii]